MCVQIVRNKDYFYYYTEFMCMKLAYTIIHMSTYNVHTVIHIYMPTRIIMDYCTLYVFNYQIGKDDMHIQMFTVYNYEGLLLPFSNADNII